MDLIADIGTTNFRYALVNDSGQIVTTEVFSSSSFSSIEALFDLTVGTHGGVSFPVESYRNSLDLFLKSNFRNRFEDKGAYRA